MNEGTIHGTLDYKNASGHTKGQLKSRGIVIISNHEYSDASSFTLHRDPPRSCVLTILRSKNL